MDYVHRVGRRQIPDLDTGSHAALQGYSAHHYTFTVHRTTLFQHMWGNSTNSGIFDSIFDRIFSTSLSQLQMLCMWLRQSCLLLDKQTWLQLLLTLASSSIFFSRSLSRVQVLSHRLGGCRVHILYGCFFLLDPLNYLFQTIRGSGAKHICFT